MRVTSSSPFLKGLSCHFTAQIVCTCLELLYGFIVLSPELDQANSYFSEWEYYSFPLYVGSIEFAFLLTVTLS